MAQKRKNGKTKARRKFSGLGASFLSHLGKEASTIPAYAMRELTGQPQGQKAKCALKKGWFE
ncbi:MAG: hypothetical protein AAFR75_01065 [Pseudomonadota bacterium]